MGLALLYSCATVTDMPTELKDKQLLVLVEPSLHEAIRTARGNRSMGRFVRDALRAALGLRPESDCRSAQAQAAPEVAASPAQASPDSTASEVSPQ